MNDSDSNRQSAKANEVVLKEADEGLLECPRGFAPGMESPEIIPEKVMYHRSFRCQDLAPFDMPRGKNLCETPEGIHVDENTKPANAAEFNELFCDRIQDVLR